MRPHQKIYHVTNAGWLQAYDEKGRYMEAQDAYALYLERSNELLDLLPDDRPDSMLERVLLKSALGSTLWLRISQLRSRAGAHEMPASASSPFDEPDLEQRLRLERETTENLRRIERAARVAGARFFLFVIPVNPELETHENSVEDNRQVFGELEALIPPGLSADDYAPLPQDHFNNAGHEKFAQFMLEHFRAASAE